MCIRDSPDPASGPHLHLEQIREACICEERARDLHLLVQIVSMRPEVRKPSIVDYGLPATSSRQR